MRVRTWFRAAAVGFVSLVLAYGAVAAPEIGPPLAKPAAITTGLTTEVILNAVIVDPGVIAGSVIAQRLDREGRVIANLGPLSDDGLNGDGVAGDGLFVGKLVFAESKTDPIYLRVSAGFKGLLKRVVSRTITVDVTPPGVPNEPSPSNLSATVYDALVEGEIVCDEVVAQFAEDATLPQISELIASIGGTLVGRLPSLRLWQLKVACTGDATGVRTAITRLQQSPLVVFAEPNEIYTATASYPSDPAFQQGQQWGLAAINAPLAWTMTKGEPTINIAIIDSGVQKDHPDLMDKLTLRGDYASNSPLCPAQLVMPGDAGRDDAIYPFQLIPFRGHGTQVAGIAAAITDNSFGMAGVCPRCSLISSKSQNCLGKGSGLAQANAIMDSMGGDVSASVINLSLSGDYRYDSTFSKLQNAVNTAIGRGIPVVASAGNSNCNKKTFPAALPGVISVGSIDSANQHSIFKSSPSYCSDGSGSNYGEDWVDIYAPGGGITFGSDGIYAAEPNGSFTPYFCHTSAAAPFVAGVVGLMRSVNRALRPHEIRTILRQEARFTGNSSSRDPEAAPLRILDAKGAVERATKPPKISIDATKSDWDNIPLFVKFPQRVYGVANSEFKVTKDDKYIYFLGVFSESFREFEQWNIFVDADNNDKTGLQVWDSGVEGFIGVQPGADATGIGPRNDLVKPAAGVSRCNASTYCGGFSDPIVWKKGGNVIEVSIPLSTIDSMSPGSSLIRLYPGSGFNDFSCVFDLNSGRPVAQPTVKPSTGAWAASPQSLSVTACGMTEATKIYFTMVNTYDGSTPSDPPVPSSSANNGSLDGPHAVFQLYATPGQLKRSKLRFVGCNGSSCGQASAVLSYTLNLSRSGSGR